MDTRKAGEKIAQALKDEDAVDIWWAAHKKSLKENLDQYRDSISIELRKTQIEKARLIEERLVLIREILKLRKVIDRIKEAVDLH